MDDAVLCRVFQCKNPQCETLMQLPLDKLLRLTVDPTAPSTRSSAIAPICPQCTQIYTYSLLPNSSDRYSEDRLVSRDRAEEMDRLPLLECVVETCKTRLPLIAVWTPTTTIEQREANIQKINWSELQSLTCPNGHQIRYPQ
jgi:hypothetical protein